MSILYKTVSRVSTETGYTENAIRTKIRDGVWPEGDVWIKAPDGRILINVEGYNKWAENELGLRLGLKQVLKSHSNTVEEGVVKHLTLSPAPLT